MYGTVLHSSVKSFFVSLCAILGIFMGFFLILMVFGVIQSAESTPTSHFSAEVMPNAKGSRKMLSRSAPVVLKLNVHGTIGADGLTQKNIEELLIESRENTFKNDRVKAILVEINTPGGTVTDADGIYRSLLRYKSQFNVPIYAFVDGMCASGGMYIASAADKVYATETSLVGSVGVLSGPYFNASKILEVVGVDARTLSAGKGKDEMNPFRPWGPNETKPLQGIIDYYYNSFVNIVTTARPFLSKEKLISEYGAQVFPAQVAKEYGYIDVASSSYEKALTDLLHKIGIDDDYYQVVQLDQNSWTSLFKSQNSLLFGKIKHTFNLPYDMAPELSNQFLYLYKP